MHRWAGPASFLSGPAWQDKLQKWNERCDPVVHVMCLFESTRLCTCDCMDIPNSMNHQTDRDKGLVLSMGDKTWVHPMLSLRNSMEPSSDGRSKR